MKRLTGLTVLILFLLIPMLPVSAHIVQPHPDCSGDRFPNLERCEAAIERAAGVFERPEGIHPEGAIERSRRLLPDPVNLIDPDGRETKVLIPYKDLLGPFKELGNTLTPAILYRSIDGLQKSLSVEEATTDESTATE